ncbi:MAG: hypothetical protein HOH14_02290, partial [Gammaproteobacteria bacterium]|nr:hypothetical protein [Gammaproteobacteria bacterium]
ASLMIYGLLIALSHEEIKAKQHSILKEKLNENDYRALQKIAKNTADIPRDKYLSIIDLTMPSLKQLSRIQYREFMTNLSALMFADEEISLFEWSLFKILRYTLDERVDRRLKYIPAEGLAKECEVLLSILASAGHTDTAEAASAFQAAEKYLEMKKDLSFKAELGSDTVALEKALDRLIHLKPLQKPLLLKAMVSCINADGQVTAEETELLRAVGSLLDCPIPPLLPGQRFI